jgi:MFS family permease
VPTTNASAAAAAPEQHAPAPGWLYGLVTVPFGVASGFAQFTCPFLFGRFGMPMSEINTYAALFLQPAAWQFLWAPVVEVGPRRKHWLVLLSALGALCLFAAICMPLPTDLRWFARLCLAAQVFTGLTGACNGALMATLPNEQRGSAGGWSNAGNLGGAALGGGLLMFSFSHGAPRPVIGALAAAMTFLPALGALVIVEPARSSRRLGDVVVGMLRSVAATVFSRAGITGILICASPVGTAALLNVFSGMGPEYHASEDVVTFVTGFMGGLVTAVGALLGGYICDRIPRRTAYLCAGALTAVCGLSMSYFPFTERTYIIGATTYLFVTGFCYAAFTALVLEVVGTGGPDGGQFTATRYTLFTAAGNLAISYTNYIDGKGADRWGTRGMLRTDAAANLIGIVFFSIMIALIGKLSRKRQRTE